MAKKKQKLKPISFYGHKPEDVIRAFMQVDPKKVKEAAEKEAIMLASCQEKPPTETD